MAKRVVRKVLGLGALVLLGISACSGTGTGRGEGNNVGSGAGSSDGGTGGSSDPDIPIDLGGNGGEGGDGPILTTCNADMPCPADQVCVRKDDAGVCSPAGPECDPNNDTCDNDTYCCAGDCRLDGVATGVCVVGDTRPVNNACNTAIAVGVFAPDLQCEWTEPPAGDPYPAHRDVSMTPLVANLPNDSGTAVEIIVVTMDRTAGDGSDGRLRILNGQTCAQVEVVGGPGLSFAATPAIGNLDADADLEIVARTKGDPNVPRPGGYVAFDWNGAQFQEMWQFQAMSGPGDINPWDGASLHDLNGDGKAEVIGAGGLVLNGETGAPLAAASTDVGVRSDPVLGDVDADGKIELIGAKVFEWNGSGWTAEHNGVNAPPLASPSFYGFADFGTPSGGGFDATTKDGIAEIVATGAMGSGVAGDASGSVGVYTLAGDAIMRLDFPTQPPCGGGQATGERGGPPTIGDFDGDGMPEFATAGAHAYRVFDLDCQGAASGCEDPSSFMRWSKPAQDCTSGATGSTIFDFEGDGRVEAIYADECFVRVYDGLTGDVLFSTPRASTTWWDQPIVADPDNSDRSKIIFGTSAAYSTYQFCNQALTTEPRSPSNQEAGKMGFLDRFYAGVRCEDNNDCVSQSCVEGFCRCTTDLECGNDWARDEADPQRWQDFQSGIVCADPIAGTPGVGMVCRATHPAQWLDGSKVGEHFTGVKVYRDKLDRWASSRPLWNQHVYTITNVNDDGTIPATANWTPNYTVPELNNFRQNRQGATSADLADITGALDSDNVCQFTSQGGTTFTGRICNRGLRGVGANMPASFYLGDVANGTIVCQTQTNGPVPVGGCSDIQCTANSGEVPPNTIITMVVNDAGLGARITDECNYDNNTSQVSIQACRPPR